MADDVRDRADTRYERAVDRRETLDLRPACRQLLKRLRQVDESDYEAAVRRYQEELLPAIASGGEDPVQAWTRYGRWLADRLTPGELVAVDATGRGHWLASGGPGGARGSGAERGSGGGRSPRPGAGDPAPDAMLLHFPEDRKRKALLLSTPEEPSEHQVEVRELLCE